MAQGQSPLVKVTAEMTPQNSSPQLSPTLYEDSPGERSELASKGSPETQSANPKGLDINFHGTDAGDGDATSPTTAQTLSSEHSNHLDPNGKADRSHTGESATPSSFLAPLGGHDNRGHVCTMG